MIILGLDPGLATTGYGVIKKTGSKITMLDYGTLKTPANTPLPQRLKSIATQLTELLNTYAIDEFAIESLFFNTNTKTAIDVAQARGVLVLLGEQANKPIYNYTPPQVKSGICGYGKAIKSQVQFMVKKLLNLKTTPKPDDAADALALAICHSNYNHVQKQQFL